MIPALIVFLCFCAALFVWLWERIEGQNEYDD